MSTRDRSLIAVVVLIIVAVAGYFVLVQPEHHKANQLQTQIGSEQTALHQAESEVEAGLAAEAESKIYVGQLKAISAAVPSDVQIPQLINELQAASNRNHVGFQAVTATASSAVASTTTPGTTATSFPSQSFTLSMTGTYFSVADLIGSLASFVHADDKHFRATGRLISISSVSFTPGSSGTATTSDPHAVTASITALDYDVPVALLSGATSASTG